MLQYDTGRIFVNISWVNVGLSLPIFMEIPIALDGDKLLNSHIHTNTNTDNDTELQRFSHTAEWEEIAVCS
jgi:hypothetical protein